MYLYTDIFIYIYTYTYIYIYYLYIYIYIYLYLYIYIGTQKYLYIYRYIYIYMHVFLHVCMCWNCVGTSNFAWQPKTFSTSSQAMKLKRQEELLRASEAEDGWSRWYLWFKCSVNSNDNYEQLYIDGIHIMDRWINR